MERFVAQEKVRFTPEALVDALSTDEERVGIEASDGRTWTRREIAQNISRYVQVLQGAGASKGTRVAYLSNNSPELVFFTFACQLADLCLVPLHSLGSIADHAFIIEDSGAEVLTFAPEFEEHVSAILAGGLKPRSTFALGPSQLGRDLVNESRGFQAKELLAPKIDGSTISRLSYTGGTTGKPKGVMVPYNSFRQMLAIQLKEWEWPSRVRHLVCAPLSHAGASAVLPTLILGGTLIILPKFDAAAVLKAIEVQEITSTLLVPSMIAALLRHDDINKRDLHSLETVFYGGASIAPDLLGRAIERFGLIFSQFYAQAEAPMVVSLLRKGEHDHTIAGRAESCGRPLPEIEVRLVDPQDREVEPGERGELCIRGSIVAAGYWNRPLETAEAFRDGWLHTGDIAIADLDGFLRIVDRKKDMVISGGFNIYSREVEDALTSHPSVAAAAIIGIPDDSWGEAVKAYVVLRVDGQQASALDLQAHVRKLKGGACTPKFIEFIDQIPLTSLGKPDKALLKSRSIAGMT